MKLCRYCHKRYPPSEFGVALTTKDKVYRRHKCKNCYRENKRLLNQKHRDWVKRFKSERKCARCKVGDWRVLEFHHRDRKHKEFGIAVGLYNHFGLERLKKEISKCVILCANCHRILHSEENGA